MTGTPYLSVVATARNDDHGGNLLGRMQIFVDALFAQARRHNVSIELVLVEWNPLPDRRPLAEVLRWPADLEDGAVRIITVPPALHDKYEHSGSLPLYQMIAKNVGIRRARGEFVLATNIDIVFSGELFQYLSKCPLERGRMYRIDRHDVDTDVPVEGSLDEQLDYCRTHLLRISAREGTFNVTPDGLRALYPDDIAAQESGILFGRGWFAVEGVFGALHRWAEAESELLLRPIDEARDLMIELEPGPGADGDPLDVAAIDETGATLLDARLDCRAIMRLPVPPSADLRRIRIVVRGGGFGVPSDPRVLNMKAWRCWWRTGGGVAPAALLRPKSTWIGRQLLKPVRLCAIALRGFRFLFLLRKARTPMRIGLPIAPPVIEKLDVRVEAGVVSVAVGPRPKSVPIPGPAPVHTNACGDFTLLAREDWLDLRGYPEFDAYSMNIDSVFCFTAHYGGVLQEILPEPMRIYHIEHSIGSGWTPEGQERLYERITGKGIPWIEFADVVGWARQMQRFGLPMIFNRESWGMGLEDLPETTPRPHQ
jgi:hypothetical protein